MEMTRNFGCTKEGNQASLYVIRNENGMEAAVTDLGATLVSLKVKIKREAWRTLFWDMKTRPVMRQVRAFRNDCRKKCKPDWRRAI